MPIINGTAGNDTLTSGAINDVLNGLAGNDVLIGGGGADNFNGGNGNDSLEVTAQTDIVAGETYNGGLGFDRLFLNTGAIIDLTSTNINADVEWLRSFGIVTLKSAQLDGFFRVETDGAVNVSDAGVITLDGDVLTGTFNLSAAGNTFSLAGVSNTNYAINGGAAADNITGGDHSGGDSLTGTGGNDNLTGGVGDDFLNGGVDMDVVNGGIGNDRLFVGGPADLVAGEQYFGGDGFDQFDLETGAPVDITGVTIGADVEWIQSGGDVVMTAAQLEAFRYVQTGKVTLTTLGTVSFIEPGAGVENATTFGLADGGVNKFSLAGVINNGYTINGGNGNEILTGGDASFTGDTLNGNLGNDNLTGGLGTDALFGGDGKDSVSGDGGDDRLLVFAETELSAGETFKGGAGFDRLDLETGNAVNISTIVIASDIEHLESGGLVSATAAQLSAFRQINTGAITVTNAGVVSFVGDFIGTTTFNLSALGNTLSLSGVSDTTYTVHGNNGVDVITGGDHVSGDGLNGNLGNDNLSGAGGNDSLFGGGGKDVQSGGAGDDRLFITQQTDIAVGEQFFGGIGFDILDLETGTAINITQAVVSLDIERLEAGAAVTLTSAQLAGFSNVQTGAITITTAGVVNFTNETVITNVFNLAAPGNNFNLSGVGNTTYTVNGANGNDTVIGGDHIFGDGLNGGGGNDNLNAALGNDSLTGSAGKDTVNGASGNDRLFVFAQADLAAGESFIGGTGFDILDLETGAAINLTAVTIATDIERLEANGPVTVTAAQLDAFKNLSTGAITITTGGVVDLSDADIGTQTFNLAAAGNNLNLGGATENVYIVNGAVGAANDTITGGDHNTGDALNGSNGNDVINGGAGNDLLIGGAGKDTVNGGLGNDVLRAILQTDLIPGEVYTGGQGNDTFDLETGAAINISTVTIGTDIERLESSGSVSVAVAQLGAFTNIATGVVTLTNAGVVDLSNAHLQMLNGTFNLFNGINDITFAGVQSHSVTVNGHNGADKITGTDNVNGDILVGSFGNDNISGGAGHDTLTGGAGTDQQSGGAGNDRLIITAQAEIVGGENYNGGAGIDTLDLETVNSINLTPAIINADVEALEASGAVSLTAAQLNAFRSVATGAITLTSVGVADLSDANFFNGVTTQTFNLNVGGNTLDLTGQLGNAYVVNGGAAADIIRGGDHLNGDTITGGGGKDTVTGGAGADDYLLNAAAGLDTILDFSGSGGDGDQLNFLAQLVGSFSYIGAAAFSGSTNSEARFAGAETVEVDINGNGIADVSVIIDGLVAAGQLTAADFFWS